MLPYSAKKKETKGTEECSVKKPETNSDSIKNIILNWCNIFYIIFIIIYLPTVLLDIFRYFANSNYC